MKWLTLTNILFFLSNGAFAQALSVKLLAIMVGADLVVLGLKILKVIP